MPLYDSPAVILKTIRLGEADKIATLFTERFGKIKVVAKGAFRPKSRFGGRLEPFTHVRAIFFGKERAELFRLNSLDMIDPYIPLRSDLEKLGRAYVSAELVDIVQREGDANPGGFAILLALWRALAGEGRPERMSLLLRLFELKYISGAGYRPVLERCVICGAAPEGAKVWFDPFKGGTVCASCAVSDPSAAVTTMGAVKLMSRSLALPMDKIGRLSAGGALLGEIEAVIKSFIGAHLRREMRSEKFLSLGAPDGA